MRQLLHGASRVRIAAASATHVSASYRRVTSTQVERGKALHEEYVSRSTGSRPRRGGHHLGPQGPRESLCALRGRSRHAVEARQRGQRVEVARSSWAARRPEARRRRASRTRATSETRVDGSAERGSAGGKVLLGSVHRAATSLAAEARSPQGRRAGRRGRAAAHLGGDRIPCQRSPPARSRAVRPPRCKKVAGCRGRCARAPSSVSPPIGAGVTGAREGGDHRWGRRPRMTHLRPNHETPSLAACSVASIA